MTKRQQVNVLTGEIQLLHSELVSFERDLNGRNGWRVSDADVQRVKAELKEAVAQLRVLQARRSA